jgi:hypothetical protein
VELRLRLHLRLLRAGLEELRPWRSDLRRVVRAVGVEAVAEKAAPASPTWHGAPPRRPCSSSTVAGVRCCASARSASACAPRERRSDAGGERRERRAGGETERLGCRRPGDARTGGVAAFCSICCGSCWSHYSCHRYCKLQMQERLRRLLEMVLDCLHQLPHPGPSAFCSTDGNCSKSSRSCNSCCKMQQVPPRVHSRGVCIPTASRTPPPSSCLSPTPFSSHTRTPPRLHSHSPPPPVSIDRGAHRVADLLLCCKPRRPRRYPPTLRAAVQAI